jgi:hypothetical protein
MNKARTVKFRIEDLLPIGFTFVVLGLGLAYGLQIMGEVKDDMTSGTEEYDAVNNTIQGVAKIPEKLPTLATVVMASVLIGVLVTYLYARFAR